MMMPYKTSSFFSAILDQTILLGHHAATPPIIGWTRENCPEDILDRCDDIEHLRWVFLVPEVMKTDVDYMIEMGMAGIREHKISTQYEKDEAIVLYQVHFVGFNPVIIN
jgi:hypothetical protein